MIQEDHGSLTEISDSGKHISFSHKNKSLSLALFVSLLLVATIAAVVTPVNSQNSNKNGAAHSIIKMSCSSTRYPELCYSAIANGPGAAASLAAINDENDVLIQSIKATQQAIDTNTADIESYKTTNKMTLTNQQTDALDASTDNNELSQSDLQNAENSLLYYTNEIPLSDQDDGPDINTPLSSCITYQDTIMDGFSHTAADKEVRKDISDGVDNVRKMCMNYSGNEHEHDSHSHCNELKTTKRNLKEENSRNESGWPKWLSVSQQEVVAVIIIDTRCGGGCWMAAGIIVQYQLQLLLPQREAVGGKTIITASRSVVDGITAFRSATVAAMGEGFLARDIAFENTAGPSNRQAVALRVSSDRAAFYKCNVLGYQDTLHVHANRQFFINCLIAGTVDFIFGNSAVVFQDCDIHARRPNPGQTITITAQGRSDPNQKTGIVIQKSRIHATSDLLPVRSNFSAYLGRPWKEYSRTVVMQSSISDVISSAGWLEWRGKYALNTLYYGEYNNSGAGAATSERVNWKGYKVITATAEAKSFTPRNFIAGSTWLKSTTFPFSLDL
uniref:Pectinesterase n=1 Tax=Populus alba TaxID=43335 RepID=A0A4U5P2H4_POPAL|nr:putative pectin methylesterase [Populus alba]